MNNVKRKNFFVIDREKFVEYNTKNIKKVVEILNKDKLVIIKGLKNTGKINFIKEFIYKTKLSQNYFYFNKSDDIENNISTGNDLEILLNEYIKLYKIPKILILQDISKLDGVKIFITNIYKQNYKTILVGNTIKIGGIKELEIHNNIDIKQENYETSLKYGSINEVKQVESIDLKKKILNLIVSDIFLNDIFKNYGVKSIDLYTFTITFLAYNEVFLSLRELQKMLNDIQNISLKTVIDYIDFSIQEKIIKRSYKYDLKNNKTITTKAKYYFSDNGIRNSLGDFDIKNELLIENQVFNILELYNYNIYSGFIGNFDFTFYGEIPVSEFPGDGELINIDKKIYVHISKETTKEDLKKEVNRFLKIGDDYKKYVLIENALDLGIKKMIYENVEIVEICNFLGNFGKKQNLSEA